VQNRCDQSIIASEGVVVFPMRMSLAVLVWSCPFQTTSVRITLQNLGSYGMTYYLWPSFSYGADMATDQYGKSEPCRIRSGLTSAWEKTFVPGPKLSFGIGTNSQTDRSHSICLKCRSHRARFPHRLESSSGQTDGRYCLKAPIQLLRLLRSMPTAT